MVDHSAFQAYHTLKLVVPVTSDLVVRSLSSTQIHTPTIYLLSESVTPTISQYHNQDQEYHQNPIWMNPPGCFSLVSLVSPPSWSTRLYSGDAIPIPRASLWQKAPRSCSSTEAFPSTKRSKTCGKTVRNSHFVCPKEGCFIMFYHHAPIKIELLLGSIHMFSHVETPR